MKIKYEFNVDPGEENLDSYLHNVYSQSEQTMDVLQAITGRYACSNSYDYSFKGLLKYDGLSSIIDKAIKEVDADPSYHGLDSLSTPDDRLKAVVYTIVSDMEDSFYSLLNEAGVRIDDC